jgi:hypothetical protein
VALGGTSVAAVTQLANGSVKTPKLANGAVTAPKLANGSVGASKIAPGAVIAGKGGGGRSARPSWPTTLSGPRSWQPAP